MPSYDYRCKDCSLEFTVERSMNDSVDTECLKCGSESVSRIWNMQFNTKSNSSSEKSQGPCCGGSCHS